MGWKADGERRPLSNKIAPILCAFDHTSHVSQLLLPVCEGGGQMVSKTHLDELSDQQKERALVHLTHQEEPV